ncbi:MAG: hypothetical protein MPJ22_00945 [Pirellulales bacterium]|nr:hypothetical protein [Pirellulales bacterium]MDA8040976.1 hypothetical protein [Pirellulales bacterium]
MADDVKENLAAQMSSLLGSGWRRVGRLQKVKVPGFSAPLYEVHLGDAYGVHGLPPHIITYLGRWFTTVIRPKTDTQGTPRLALYVMPRKH